VKNLTTVCAVRHIAKCTSLNVTAELLAFLLCIWVVSGLNLNPEIGYPGRLLAVFYFQLFQAYTGIAL